MTVEEVLKTVSLYLDKYEVFEDYFTNNELNASEDVKIEFEKILCAINNICVKIADNLNVLKFREKLKVENFKINFNKLSKKYKTIKKIITVEGNKRLSFKKFDDYIYINFDGEVYVEYIYFPDKLKSISDEIVFKNINIRTFALGVISEYCFMIGLFDDAQIWEERFLTEIKSKGDFYNGFVMPRKKWGI